jgi:hypothetical protein
MFHLPLKSIHYLSRRLIPEPSLTGFHAPACRSRLPSRMVASDRPEFALKIHSPSGALSRNRLLRYDLACP